MPNRWSTNPDCCTKYDQESGLPREPLVRTLIWTPLTFIKTPRNLSTHSHIYSPRGIPLFMEERFSDKKFHLVKKKLSVPIYLFRQIIMIMSSSMNVTGETEVFYFIYYSFCEFQTLRRKRVEGFYSKILYELLLN